MKLIFFITGTIIIIAAIADALWTILWVDNSSGPLTSRLTYFIWRGAKSISGQKGHHLFLSLAGPAALFIVLLMWVILLLVGWTMIFTSDRNAILGFRNLEPASLSSRIYFTAYTLFTLGIGDYVPLKGFWQITTSVASGTGILIIFLAITYQIEIVSAVANKRVFASRVTGIALQPEEFILANWDGREFGVLSLQLSTMAGQLSLLTEQHLAYPILHYYHAPESRKSNTIAIAILDEALTILEFGVPKPYGPSQTTLLPVRKAIDDYLGILRTAFIKPADQPPSPPNLSILRSAGVPVVEDEEFHEAVDRLSERRKLLLGMVYNDARRWPAI